MHNYRNWCLDQGLQFEACAMRFRKVSLGCTCSGSASSQAVHIGLGTGLSSMLSQTALRLQLLVITALIVKTHRVIAINCPNNTYNG